MNDPAYSYDVDDSVPTERYPSAPPVSLIRDILVEPTLQSYIHEEPRVTASNAIWAVSATLACIEVSTLGWLDGGIVAILCALLVAFDPWGRR